MTARLSAIGLGQSVVLTLSPVNYSEDAKQFRILNGMIMGGDLQK